MLATALTGALGVRRRLFFGRPDQDAQSDYAFDCTVTEFAHPLRKAGKTWEEIAEAMAPQRRISADRLMRIYNKHKHELWEP